MALISLRSLHETGHLWSVAITASVRNRPRVDHVNGALRRRCRRPLGTVTFELLPALTDEFGLDERVRQHRLFLLLGAARCGPMARGSGLPVQVRCMLGARRGTPSASTVSRRRSGLSRRRLAALWSCGRR